MTAPRIVVVGHCTTTTARILCCTEGPAAGRAARLLWRSHGRTGVVETLLSEAPPYALGVLHLRELPAGGTVDYAIAIDADPSSLPTRRFRLLPAERPTVDLGAGVRGRLMPITEHGHDLMNRRNFALLDFDGGSLRVRLFGEGLAAPRGFMLPSR